MTPRRAPHLTMAHRWRSELPMSERLLHALGANPTFAEAVLGDLAEERARRREAQGAFGAGAWYAREALRAIPHLLLNAIRHGGAQGRARAAIVLGVLALIPVTALLVLLRGPAPAFLFVDGQHGGADGIVLNTTQPVQLAMRVLDAKGNVLPSNDVRFEWMSGTSVPVTSTGIVSCTMAGDALLRATVGKVETTMVLRCRPVKEFLTQLWVPLVAGGPPRYMQFSATGADGLPVELLAGDLSIGDTTVATLHGFRLTPVAPGHTWVTMRIGNGTTTTTVSVFESVSTLAERRDDQRFVIAPVKLARGKTIDWPLPEGKLWLLYESVGEDNPIPKLRVNGPALCAPELGPQVPFVRCIVRGRGATLHLAHPGKGAAKVDGHLALELDQQP
jgi:hypothetical protein